MRTLIFFFCLGWGVGAMASPDVEEPSWVLVSELEDVEIRRYQPVIQARTSIAHKGQTTNGFRTLADYIFGANSQDQAIAMTAPVEEVLSEEDPYMAFTMPSQYRLEDLPEPDDGNVTLHPVPLRTVAAVRFSGWARGSVVATKTRLLLDTLEGSEWVPVGSPSLNQYNPPWTPPWMRRNEVMVAVQLIK